MLGFVQHSGPSAIIGTLNAQLLLCLKCFLGFEQNRIATPLPRSSICVAHNAVLLFWAYSWRHCSLASISSWYFWCHNTILYHVMTAALLLMSESGCVAGISSSTVSRRGLWHFLVFDDPTCFSLKISVRMLNDLLLASFFKVQIRNNLTSARNQTLMRLDSWENLCIPNFVCDAVCATEVILPAARVCSGICSIISLTRVFWTICKIKDRFVKTKQTGGKNKSWSNMVATANHILTEKQALTRYTCLQNQTSLQGDPGTFYMIVSMKTHCSGCCKAFFFHD